MPEKDSLIVGFNHMFLYPDSMTDGNIHTKTLEQLSQLQGFDALDCWVWAANAKEELAALKGSGKQINYNIGDRPGDKPVFPATADPGERAYSLDILRRETDFALEAGAKKIIFGSGKDVPENREDAKKRFEEFILQWSEFIPQDVWLTLEPTDRDVDKHFLFGSMAETRETVYNIRKAGMANFGILLDMGHIPIMHETLQSAAMAAGELLEHIHLGNCVIKDKTSPYYGDKHPCWGYPGGEYDETDGAIFLEELKKAGYFYRGNPRTVSFEMRPLTGKTAEQTVEYLSHWIKRTYAGI